jgi:cobyrinic acid a,c-diamide synthase
MIDCPRITIAGLGGDSGKTVLAVGLCNHFYKKGLKVVPFKKGPDYIDMAWLKEGARYPCFNIDLFLMNDRQLLQSFELNTRRADIAVIEGNRGVYDGMDEMGSVSTAEVAKLLKSPIILVIDSTKVTRTIAAIVLGCQRFDPEVDIKGVVINKIGTSRHEEIIRKSVERYCGIPVIGAIPRMKDVKFPGRHLGLVPPQEHFLAKEAVDKASEIVEKYVDIDMLISIAKTAPVLNNDFLTINVEHKVRDINIGVIRDSAFHFYYEENINSLKNSGANVIEFSALKDYLPDNLDALYIGGGFPETHAEVLSENVRLRESIKEAGEKGMPIYAECGGLMYLAEKLMWRGKWFPMVGLLPLSINVSDKPKGHGYTVIEVCEDNNFFRKNTILKGHEFHYSYVEQINNNIKIRFIFKVKKGSGIKENMDGISYKNILATYTHLHAMGYPEWVKGLMNMALWFRNYRKN